MLTLLSRGPNDKVEKSNALVVLIVDNMYKIVEDPAAIIPVTPKLEPLVKAACEKIFKLHDRNLYGTSNKDLKPFFSFVMKASQTKPTLTGS